MSSNGLILFCWGLSPGGTKRASTIGSQRERHLYPDVRQRPNRGAPHPRGLPAGGPVWLRTVPLALSRGSSYLPSGGPFATLRATRCDGLVAQATRKRCSAGIRTQLKRPACGRPAIQSLRRSEQCCPCLQRPRTHLRCYRARPAARQRPESTANDAGLGETGHCLRHAHRMTQASSHSSAFP